MSSPSLWTRLPIAFALLASVLVVPCLPGQNSGRKIRPEPSELAARCGSWVDWRPDLDAALAESKESGRPVFWYVPTLFRSPMDRQVEIDRYMMAGPFSWPRCIEVLNDRFVPVRQAATRADLERFEGLRPGGFIEPGFLVLDGTGAVLATWDEITTLHPEWWRRRLSESLEAAGADGLAKVWPALVVGDDARPSESGPSDGGPGGVGNADVVTKAFVDGVLVWMTGDTEAARELWTELAAAHPDHPLAAKALAEAEGHGPIVNGFEVPFALQPEALAAGPRGTRTARDDWRLEELRAVHSRAFSMVQRNDGGLRDSRYDFGGTDSLPNVYVAVTGVVARALLEWSAVETLSGTDEATFRKAVSFLRDDSNLNPDDSDELVWAYLYRLELWNRWLELRPGDRDEILPQLRRDHGALVAMQDSRGAWSHEYPNPFVTASVLIALAGARDHGVETESLPISKAIGFLKSCRTEDGAITYGAPRGPARAPVGGGVGRMPLVEHALLAWGEGSQEDLANALAKSFEFEDELFRVRKYDDHASRLGYGGFFFWYDLKVRHEALQALADEPRRNDWMAAQRERILTLPEFDGCFVDSHEIGRSYGTAMAWLSGL